MAATILGQRGVIEYSPLKVIVYVGTQLITGWESVSVERSGDMSAGVVGTDGTVIQNRSANKSGMVNININRGAASTPYLSNLFHQEDLNQSGRTVITIYDTNGSTIISGFECFPSKWPATSFEMENATLEWTFFVSYLRLNYGSSYKVSTIGGTPPALPETAAA